MMNARAIGALQVTGWIEAAVAKYGSVAIGVAVGIGAKYGLVLGEGRQVTARMVVIDALLVGMVVLLAANVAERIGATGNSAALVASLFAVSSDRLLRLIRQRFIKHAEAELIADVDRLKGELRQTAAIEIGVERVINDIATGKRDLDA